ncbi:MAG: hypothetical protein ACJ8KU_06170 [Chthoniobacterales bacterium]
MNERDSFRSQAAGEIALRNILMEVQLQDTPEPIDRDGGSRAITVRLRLPGAS